MNEHDEDIARLFANVEPLRVSAEFAAALRLAINRERRKAKFVATASAVAIALIIAVAVFMIPFGSLYPIRVVQEFLTSIRGVLVCAACAAVLTIWLRFSDA